MNIFSIKEVKEESDFDPTKHFSHTSFTQSFLYGKWQQAVGRKVKRFVINQDSKPKAYFQIVVHPLIFKKTYCYIPYGPIVDDVSIDLLKYIKKEIKKIAKSENSVFVKLDFTPKISSKILNQVFTKCSKFFIRSAIFQSRNERFLPITKSEEELLKDMHQKTRYCIRLSQRSGLTAHTIDRDFSKYFDTFINLMQITSKRNGFRLHTSDYYKSVFQNLREGIDYISITKYNDEILSASLVCVVGKTATYVYGASSNTQRKQSPGLLGLWNAVCAAKQKNCTIFNFGGVIKLKFRNYETLANFKEKFGGVNVEHSDFFDIVINPFYYSLYTLRRILKNIR